MIIDLLDAKTGEDLSLHPYFKNFEIEHIPSIGSTMSFNINNETKLFVVEHVEFENVFGSKLFKNKIFVSEKIKEEVDPNLLFVKMFLMDKNCYNGDGVEYHFKTKKEAVDYLLTNNLLEDELRISFSFYSASKVPFECFLYESYYYEGSTIYNTTNSKGVKKNDFFS